MHRGHPWASRAFGDGRRARGKSPVQHRARRARSRSGALPFGDQAPETSSRTSRNTVQVRDVVISWSGGKDSALALWRARARGLRPIALLTMLDETGERSRSHGLPVDVLQAQAASIGVPLVTASATWAAYTDAFVRALSGLATSDVPACVFGDIDI